MSEPRRDMVLLFSAALVILGLFLVFALRDPVFLKTSVDEEYYLGTAREIASGRLLGDNPFRTPLYAYLIAPIALVAGTSALLMVRLFQALAAAASVVLLYRIGRRAFGPPAGIAASLLLLGYWPFVYHAGEIVGETFFILFMLHFLDLVTGGAGDFQKPLLPLWAGFVLSLAVLLRPNALPLLGPALLGIFLSAPREKAGSLRAAALLLAGFVPMLALNAVRNQMNAGSPVPVSSQAGINFFIGNCPGSTGFTATLPGLRTDWLYPQLKAFTEDRTGRRMTFREVADYWNSESLGLFREHPRELGRNLLKKTVLFLNHFEIGNNREITQFRRTNPALRFLPVTFPLLLALSLWGTAAVSRRDPAFWVLLLSWLVLSLGVLVFFVCSRYRLPVVPFMALFGGVAVADLPRRFLAPRGWGMKAAAIAVIVAAASFSSMTVYKLTEEGYLFARDIDLGNLARQQGDNAAAERYYLQALKVKPGAHDVRLNLAGALLDLGRNQEALREFDRVGREGGKLFSYNALVGQGKVHRAMRDYRAASAFFFRALDERPGSLDVAAALTLTSLAGGDAEGGFRAMMKGVELGGRAAFQGLLLDLAQPEELKNALASLDAPSSLQDSQRRWARALLMP